MQYATGRPLPSRPLTLLQLSVRWVSLAVPSAAGRVGMNAAFLMKLEITATRAVVQGAIDSGAGFITEAVPFS
jgi:hypothetical protein